MSGWKEAALKHAKAEIPREACGLLVVVKGRERYWPCKNLISGNEFFLLDPEDYADAEDAGEIVAIVHSHPHTPPQPSEADKISAEKSGLPWHIVQPVTETWGSYEPCGYEIPLIGRPWLWIVSDCWTLVRDWYKQEWGLELSDYERHGEWWHKGMNTFVENFANEDFVSVGQDAEPQYGDALLMQIVSPVSNHVAIYIGNDLILQHLERRLSSRDLWSGYYRKNTTHILRHRSRL